MKIQSVILFGILGVIGFFSYSEAYADRHSNVESQLKAMNRPTMDCYLGRRTCNYEDYYAKQHLADKFSHNCSKCDGNMRQKLANQIPMLNYLFPEDFQLLVNIYSAPSVLECLLNNGPCNPKLKAFKTILPYYLKNSECPGCSDDFKEKMVKRINFLIKYRPREWRRIVEKYRRQ
ncbi:uncharacterized protein LOC130676779 [Microplitis mediator]|uniref:uncharacterized protein LOC130676779 n=1 Tax=Microplitis mediator TaxID=375433 RepID=UPI00255400FA|nr:uncharacterized protein LOC130676779 [Microplitis mediator]